MTRLLSMLGLCLGVSMFALLAFAELPSDRVGDIYNTKHNFSVNAPSLAAGQNRTVAATTETRVCIFCHTPHRSVTYNAPGSNLPEAPLWNRSTASGTYTRYTSSSSEAIQVPTRVKSKMCLSCHDGSLAIGEVAVITGNQSGRINLTGTNASGAIPAGEGVESGYTSQLGGADPARSIDLSNDHPISIVYDASLASNDGELFSPDLVPQIGVRGPRANPLVPLEPAMVSPTPAYADATLECTSCHDPHIRSTDPTQGNIKFLRLHRFQTKPPVQGVFDKDGDIGCIACHDKKGWFNSAHAQPTVSDELYSQAAAVLREFQIDAAYTTPMPVWKASCLNCHDAHTVTGARSLLRAGNDFILTTANTAKQGGSAAQEESCLGCHSSDGQVLQVGSNQTPDIKSDYIGANIRMPITTAHQTSSIEEHNAFDPSINPPDESQYGKDHIEPKTQLGFGDQSKRHAECTDCHNPHRAAKSRLAMTEGTVDAAGTHTHEQGVMHTNIASGVLRGIWGVEPIYEFGAGESFMQPAAGFIVKRGDPGGSTSQLVTEPYVTREYQVCFKCHSSYALGSEPLPHLGDSAVGTQPGNAFPVGMTQYTNPAMEFQASQKGDGQAQDSGADVNFTANNHRSWHPVIDSTGRSAVQASAFLPPFDLGIGAQTMYCSDCHGSVTAAATVEPSGGDAGKPWGPHGSSENFILKGAWNAATGTATPDHLCFKCHRYEDYADAANTTPSNSGFASPDIAAGVCQPSMNNLHVGHAKCLTQIHCSDCHVAVPHGFKNKGLLVNLNDVGPEAGLVSGTVIPNTVTAYTNPPYYGEAKLWVNNFSPSGQWSAINCSGVNGCHDGL